MGSDAAAPDPEVVTRSQWASGTLDAYRHLFTEMATALGATGDDEQAPDAAGDPMMAMMAGLSKMMAPAMLGMAVGSMVGHLATRAFGTHDLPIPRRPNSVTLLPSNIDAFATDWEIPQDEMRLWVLAHELAGHALFEADHLPRRAQRPRPPATSAGFRPDPNAVAERLGSLDADADDPMAALQSALGDPEVLLGAVTSPAQLELRPRLDALVAVVVGYTDWIVDAVAVRVVGGNALRIAEAVRRRRVETTASDTFVEQLLGIRLGEAQVARGKAFVQGVVDRAGDDGLRPLLDAGRRRADAEPRSTPRASGSPASSPEGDRINGVRHAGPDPHPVLGWSSAGPVSPTRRARSGRGRRPAPGRRGCRSRRSGRR